MYFLGPACRGGNVFSHDFQGAARVHPPSQVHTTPVSFLASSGGSINRPELGLVEITTSGQVGRPELVLVIGGNQWPT